MHDYWTATAMLFHRRQDELNEDERDSLRFYIAFIDDLDGLTPNSAPRRWCAAARVVEDFAREHGRLPASTDSGALSSWIESQNEADLNSAFRSGWGLPAPVRGGGQSSSNRRAVPVVRARVGLRMRWPGSRRRISPRRADAPGRQRPEELPVPAGASWRGRSTPTDC